MPRSRLGVRALLTCAVVVVLQTAAACSLLTDYSLSGSGGKGSSEAGDGASSGGDGSDDGSLLSDADTDAGPQPVKCTSVPCVVDIASAGESTCARTLEGDVLCWGYGRTGIIGTATAGDFSVPKKVAFDGPVDEISLGDWGQDDTTACARRGTIVECWGQDGSERRLGRGGIVSAGNFVPVPAPVVGVDAAVAISVSSQRVCVRTVGDHLSCWGKMYDKKIEAAAVFVATPKPVKQVVGGRTHDCLLLDTEEVACAGYPYYFKENWPDSGAGAGQNDFQIVSGVTGITQLASNGNVVCALKKGGVVLCWGRNQRGQLGRGVVSQESSTPVPVVLPLSAKSVMTGQNHACAILSDETVWCWGRNGGGPPRYDHTTTPRGQVGALPDGGVDEFTATPRKIALLPEGVAVHSVVGGYEHTCALLVNGAVYCWGSNVHGQLGIGRDAGTDGGIDTLAHPIPTRVLF